MGRRPSASGTVKVGRAPGDLSGTGDAVGASHIRGATAEPHGPGTRDARCGPQVMRPTAKLKRGPRTRNEVTCAGAPTGKIQRPTLHVHCAGVVEHGANGRRARTGGLGEDPRVVELRGGPTEVKEEGSVVLGVKRPTRQVVEYSPLPAVDVARAAPGCSPGIVDGATDQGLGGSAADVHPAVGYGFSCAAHRPTPPGKKTCAGERANA